MTLQGMDDYIAGEEANEDAPDENEQSPTPPGLEELTDEQRQAYEETVANAKAASFVLQKIEDAGVEWLTEGKQATSIRIKAEDCYTLMGWIVNLQNIGDLLSTQIEAAQTVISNQKQALDLYEEKTGKKLWTPGPL